MSLKVEEVKHVAKLARLSFDEKEEKDFTEKLNEVVNYVEKLKEVDVEGVKPTYHALDVKNVFRDDEVKDSFEREDMLKNAPSHIAGCFEVPKVVE
ncbi:MAG: Asp-tRNA(Asn)/Glu-tRNA(Gln) amidotransferase subunit GatC [Bacillota bacterium]